MPKEQSSLIFTEAVRLRSSFSLAGRRSWLVFSNTAKKRNINNMPFLKKEEV